MSSLDHAGHLAALRDAVGRLVDQIADADPTTPVPACPGWDLGALTGHVGATHRWVRAMVASAAPAKLPFAPFADAVPHHADELTVWLLVGAQELLETLETTSPEQPMWAFGPDRRAGSWARRMLHETTVHALDAAEALRRPGRVEARVATDGVEEFLGTVLHHPRIARRLAPPGAEPLSGTLLLAAADTGTIWRVDLGAAAVSGEVSSAPGASTESAGFLGESTEAVRGARPAPVWRRVTSTADGDAIILGGVAELYLFLWHRIPAPTVMGSPDLVAQWSRATIL